MAHQPDTGGDDSPTVYDRGGSLDTDEQAQDWWSDTLSERLNLRIPEWMFDDLEQHSDYQQQEMSEVARELLEYALMDVSFNEWNGIQQFGRHTYGDIKCPSCACDHGLKLRWRKDRTGETVVTCHECGAEMSVEAGRTMKTLDRDLQEIWYSYALGDEYNGGSPHEFERFVDDPRAFIEQVDWYEDRTSRGREVSEAPRTSKSHKETVYEHLENWEATQ